MHRGYQSIPIIPSSNPPIGKDSTQNRAMYEYFMESNFKRPPALYSAEEERAILAE